MFFEQCEKQMLGTEVVLIVIAAFLLSGLQNAPRRRTKSREQIGERLSREGKVVGAAGFEPVTSASRTQRSTKLSYAPILRTNSSGKVLEIPNRRSRSCRERRIFVDWQCARASSPWRALDEGPTETDV